MDIVLHGASQCGGSSLPGLLQLETLSLIDSWHCRSHLLLGEEIVSLNVNPDRVLYNCDNW